MNNQENPAIHDLRLEWLEYKEYFGDDIGQFSAFVTIVFDGLVHKMKFRTLGDYEQFLYDNLFTIFVHQTKKGAIK